MEAKVIKIDIDGNDLECADELEKIIVEAITEAITQSIELKHKQENLAEKAFDTWMKVKDQHLADIKIACGGKLPEGEHLLSLMFAGGFKEGYQTKEAECRECD